MRSLIQKFDGYVTFFDYCLSFNQLLLRCSYLDDEKTYNTDFLFASVFYLQTVTSFGDGFELYEGNEADKEYLSSLINETIYWQFGLRAFVFKKGEKDYFVIAGSVKISTNNLPNSQTSIEMKKEWYKPTTSEELKTMIDEDQKEFDEYMKNRK